MLNHKLSTELFKRMNKKTKIHSHTFIFESKQYTETHFACENRTNNI